MAKRLAAVIVIAAIALGVVMAWGEAYSFYSKAKAAQSLNDSSVFRENKNDYVIGELGGVPVRIPRAYAHLVEYDGAPHWLEPRKGRTPQRNFQSKLASFGFDLGFPEVEVRTIENSRQNRDVGKYGQIWMSVGVSSNSTYGSDGDNALDNYTKGNIFAESGPGYRYQQMSEQLYDLVGYEPIGADELKRINGHSPDYNDKNIYIHRGEHGKVDTYIECSNKAHVLAPCTLKFNMLPEMRVRVSILFSKGYLSEWKEIVSSTRNIILSFRANP
ncbi:hypothetical protein GCM10027343_41730 [Noviherbaspirillum agri]